MYITDPIERMENRIDELIEDQCAGLPPDQMRCYDCRKVFHIDGLEPSAERPDSPAICAFCAEARMIGP